MAEQQKPVEPAKPVEPPKKMEFKLLGHNYQTPDLVAKVTGAAKYAEDFRADGMVFIKLMPSPRPHAKIRSIDASAALAMPGVHGILTAKDLPAPPAPPGGPPCRSRARAPRRSACCWSACSRCVQRQPRPLEHLPPEHPPLVRRRRNRYASSRDTRGRHPGSASRSSGWWWRSRRPGPGCRRGPGDRAAAAADAA